MGRHPKPFTAPDITQQLDPPQNLWQSKPDRLSMSLSRRFQEIPAGSHPPARLALNEASTRVSCQQIGLINVKPGIA
jgi:hypothetical protein